MKEHLPAESVMGSRPQEAFYAERPWVKMPAGTFDEIVTTARSKGIRYLIVDEKTEASSPGFLEKAKQGEVTPVMEWKKENQRLWLFEIPPPKGT